MLSVTAAPPARAITWTCVRGNGPKQIRVYNARWGGSRKIECEFEKLAFNYGSYDVALEYV